MADTLGIVGGSGLYELSGLTELETLAVETPFGAPSDAILRGKLGEATLLFLPRHGRGHRIPPHTINYRANVCALKMLGAEQVVSVSAVGSLREDIHPGDVVIVDQYVDLTKRRVSTFFDEGCAAHVSFADPVCAALAEASARAAEAAGARVVRGGTYVCMEGPQFSSRAESQIYRGWGAAVIGMTAMPEAKLAREAELPYATIAFVTDYDAWHVSEAPVSVAAVLAVLAKNVELSRRLVRELAARLPRAAESAASRALDHALITAPGAITPEARARLGFLLERRRQSEP
jgi:5'-methylthioadenosine phosphorylase